MFFFRYIYGGILSLEEHDTLDIIKILVAANEFSLQDQRGVPDFEKIPI